MVRLVAGPREAYGRPMGGLSAWVGGWVHPGRPMGAGGGLVVREAGEQCGGGGEGQKGEVVKGA